ncbi:unnamed protein product [Effrenium voratum]|uniref:Uncharacterized protein n=1 Tax=Effrenium voratum TaxID=2562239 RepID=A0AA36I689_9DINO|nr:unnamed protein product [Effrenium voratum]CAJ1381740.1 unnamed protein product [Effrenium voratum]CAJ1422011.1 unnamed protein product [Effrenium voratum]
MQRLLPFAVLASADVRQLQFDWIPDINGLDPLTPSSSACSSGLLDLALRGAGRAAAKALQNHNARSAELGERNFTRLSDLGPNLDEAQYGTFQGVNIVLLEGTDVHTVDNAAKEVDSNVWCKLGLTQCGHKGVAADLHSKLPSAFKQPNVVCVGFSRGVWLVTTYATMYPDNCGYVITSGSPGQMYDSTPYSWVVAFYSPIDMVDNLGIVTSDERVMVSCEHDPGCYAREVISWTGENISDEQRSALAHCGMAKGSRLISVAASGHLWLVSLAFLLLAL